MPLERANVTAASRCMLPTYPAFFGTVGLGLLLTPTTRLTETPAFAYANRVVDIHLWGTGFLILAIGFIATLALHRRRPYKLALGVAIVWMTLWAAVTVGAAFNDLASFTAWAWPAFIARACWASLISLEARET